MKNWTGENCNRLKRIIERISIEDGKYICRIIYKDPFTDIYSILLIIYVFILGGFLLWPFNFISKAKNDTRWIGYSKGIEFFGKGQAISNVSNQEIFDRLVNGKGLTLEVWLQTEDLNQSGPARILSYSRNTESCNFILAQAWDKFIIRLRTTKTSLAGNSPSLVIPDTFTSQSLKHMVIIYDFTKQEVYFNGEQRVQSNVLIGDFSNWDPNSELIIGNEVTGDMPWKGKIYYVAIYDRALAEQEIHQNYISGLRMIKEGSVNPSSLRIKDPITRYLFDEGKGNVIHDRGLTSRPLNLFIPEYIRHKKEPFLNVSINLLQSKLQFSDIILNILIFIPIGILIHGMLRTRYGLTLKISLLTLFAGTLFTLGVEWLQHFSMTRDSSIIDVSTNMTGTAIGIVMDRCYNHFLNNQTKHLRMLLFDRKD